MKKRIPHLGMRIVKTGLCVFICLLLNYIFSSRVTLISSIASIVTIESTLKSSKRGAISQIVGTVIGGIIAAALLPLALYTSLDWLYVVLLPIGCMFSIYLCILLRQKRCASICAFVYVIVMIMPFSDPNSNPYAYAFFYVLDTLIGVCVGLLVNRFIKPPTVKPEMHVETNTYSELLQYIRQRTTGTEQLILLDSHLVESQGRYQPTMMWRHRFTRPRSSVSIPVPQEYSEFHYISCVYVTWGYRVDPVLLLQTNGYVVLPAALYPVTVIWPTEAAETYKLRERVRLQRNVPRVASADAPVGHHAELRDQ